MKINFLRSRLRENGTRAGSGARSKRIDVDIPWQGVVPLVAAGVLAAILKAKPSHATVAADVKKPVAITGECKDVDVVLSSGFLSFANHAGFLKAVEEARSKDRDFSGLSVGGIMGTSAGALSGSLYAAGYTPEQIANELSKLPPVEYLKLSNQPWEGGVLNMDKVIARYRELLPPTFEALEKDFAVGVLTRDGSYKVLDSGPLPEAVVASAAIPVLFEHVSVPGVGQCMDGGKFDRVGLVGWQERAKNRGQGSRAATLVHLIARSSPFSGNENVEANDNVVVLRSPKSGVSLTSLGDFDKHYNTAFERASTHLEKSFKRV